MKLSQDQIDRVFPVKQAIRENGIKLVLDFENAALAVGDDHSHSDQELINALGHARRSLQGWINTLIEEIIPDVE